MKKVLITLMILTVAVLSYWAGGRSEGLRQAVGTFAQAQQTRSEAADEKQDDSSPPFVPGTVNVRPERQQLIGVKVNAVEKKPMTYALRLYGKVVPDETRIFRVNASTDCWIRDLSDVTTGSLVQKNQILAEALAPSYYNAQVTYLISLDNIDRIRQQLGEQTRHQQADLANNQIRVAVQALQNLGITDAQVEELANTRQARPYLQVRAPTAGVVLSRRLTLNQWFKASEEFYAIADIGKVWVYADVYEDEAVLMRPGMNVVVSQGRMGRTFSAKIGKVLPLFDPAARTLKVRIDVDNPHLDLRPDMFVDVVIPIPLPESIHIPAEAILDTGTKTVVYVDKGSGVFEPRRVATGWRLGGQVEITGGLAAGERIVVSGNFLIDSESRMELAASGEDAETGERQEPGGAAREVQKEKRQESAVIPGMDRSWADMLGHPGGRAAATDGGAKAKQKAKGSAGKYPTTSEVVDWDGPDKKGAPPRDWSGWGKFPGADYLGIKRQDKGTSSKQSNKAAAGGDKQAENKDDVSKDGAAMTDDHTTGNKPGTGDLPATAQPQAPAD